MKTKFRKLTAWLLTAAMLLTLMPMATFAADDLTDSTTGITLKDADGDDYYEVGTPDELMSFANLVNDGNDTISIELTKDIDMTGREWSTIVFAGNIDGAGHTISNLEMVETDMGSYLAGFIYSVGATVKNLYFVNCSAIITSSVTTEDDCYAGIIAAAAEGIKVENCSAINCTVKSEGVASNMSYAGGLLGGANGPVSFDYCSFQDGSVSISASGDYNTSYAGGIAAGVWDYGDGIGVSITNSFCSGDVTVTSKGYSSAGGIIGLDQNEEGTGTHIYRNCYFSGNIEGLGYAAGLSGDFCATATITNFAVLSDSITSQWTDPFIIGEKKDITSDELYIGDYTQFELNAPGDKESWLSSLTGTKITKEQASAYQVTGFKSNLYGKLADGSADVSITISKSGNVEYTAVTNADGEYIFGKQVIPGEYTLSISADDSYEAYQQAVTISYATNMEHDIARTVKVPPEVRYSTDGGSTWKEDSLMNALWNTYTAANVKIELLRDIELDSSWYAQQDLGYNSNTVILDGKGYTIKRAQGAKMLFCVRYGSNVTLKNITIDGGAVWEGDDPATRTNTGLSLSGNNAHLIYVDGGATLTLDNGVILQNSDLGASSYGAAVVVGYSDEGNGKLIMNDGVIIRGNRAESGGAICVMQSGDEFIMNGGTITGNYATSGGGAAYNEGAFTMKGGEISGNASGNNGGGVCVNGTFTLEDGEIKNNSSAAGGGGITAFTGNVILKGGSVTGNSITGSMGGGVLVHNGTLTVSGAPVIKSNKAGTADNNVYLAASKVITIGGELANTDKIGVTMKAIGTFTSGGAAYADKFASDGSGYIVAVDGENLKLVERPYIITFDANGGSVTPKSAETVDGKLAELPTPTYTGYIFNGWFTAATGGEKITTETVFESDRTVYAQWTKALTSVTTTANETTYYADLANAVTAAMASEGSTIILLDNIALTGQQIVRNFSTANSLTLDLNGYTLSRSSGNAIYLGGKTKLTITNSKDSGKFAGTININDTSELDLIGVYVEAASTGIEINNTAKLTVDKDSSVSVTNSFGKAIDVAGTVVVNGTLKGGSNEIAYAGGTVDFSGHANPDGMRMKSVSATYPLTISSILLPAEYGIYDASGKLLASDASTTEQVTIKKIIPVYTITFDANGGSVTPTSAETVDGKLAELPTPTRTGYKFNGWFDAQTGGIEITTSTVFAENKTVYAQWTEKAAVTVNDKVQTYIYNNEAKAFAILDTSLTDFTVMYFVNDAWTETAPKKAGYYSVKITRDEDDTYKAFSLEIKDGLVISKAIPSYEVPKGLTATYGDTLADVKISEHGSGWSWKDSAASVGDAGTKSFKAEFTPADTDNYEKVTVDVTVTVGKADARIVTAPEKKDLVYNGSAQALITAGTAEGGEILYSTSEDGTYASDVVVKEDAGNYEVWYKVVGDANHNDVAPAKISVSIAKKDITNATVGAFTAMTYTGKAQTPNATVTIDTLSVTGTWSDVTNVEDKATFTANGNFTGKLENISVGMAKADYTIEGDNVPTASRIKRGNTLASSKLTPSELQDADGVVLGSFAWVTPDEKMAERGEFVKQVKFTPADTNNYNETVLDVTVTVYTTSGGTQSGASLVTGGTTTTPDEPDKTEVKTETKEDGTVTAEITAPEGEETTVEIPVEKPEDITKVTVTDENGTETEIKEYEVTETGIKIPVSGNTTVEISVKNDQGGVSEKKEFIDVHPVNHWAKAAVDYVFAKGLMNGVSETEFAPDGAVSRAMFVTVLYRLEGQPDAESDRHVVPFTDVESGSYYEKAVAWGFANGVVKGISDTEYAPHIEITREQMAAMLYRYAQYKGVDVSVGENTNILSYQDALSVSEYAIPAMQYTVGAGIMKGETESTLNPQSTATRAQTATVFMRFLEIIK